MEGLIYSMTLFFMISAHSYEYTKFNWRWFSLLYSFFFHANICLQVCKDSFFYKDIQHREIFVSITGDLKQKQKTIYYSHCSNTNPNNAKYIVNVCWILSPEHEAVKFFFVLLIKIWWDSLSLLNMSGLAEQYKYLHHCMWSVVFSSRCNSCFYRNPSLSLILKQARPNY